MASKGERLDRLAVLVGGTVRGDGSVRLTDVTHDSRQAGPGCLFVAFPGARADGHAFVAEAVRAGSPAVAVEHPVPVEVPQLVVADGRAALGLLAAEVHGRPSERLAVVGVTGTNGKTSVTYLVESIARAAGLGTGVIGTVETRVGDDPVPTLRTTPEASDFQRLLASMADRGAEVVAAEVSSHALVLGRVEGTHFAVAAFTNLSRDHLDFHGDMESYYQAKARLFEPGRAGRTVVWIDDPAGARLAASLATRPLTVAGEAWADVRGAVLDSDRSGSTLLLNLGGAPRRLRLPLPGSFSVANALVAAGCGRALGIAEDHIVAGLETATPVPGRFEVVSGDHPVLVVVDYAHTPAGITTTIATARTLAAGRVIAVVGAGGDRDRDKRPLMGRAAAAADLVVVTSDNPRSEPPESIADEVAAGLPAGAHRLRILDRREAIRAAIGAAEAGDAVLVLGKGHERGQEVAGRILPFDDRLVAREELAARAAL
jgi:UDP-N-acetylmuramoyl-L-alanyl-D-glutamate--2,6-diaminopimelate ligase